MIRNRYPYTTNEICSEARQLIDMAIMLHTKYETMTMCSPESYEILGPWDNAQRSLERMSKTLMKDAANLLASGAIR